MKLVTVKNPEDVEKVDILLETNEHGNITRVVVENPWPPGGTAFIVETDAYSSLRVRKPAPWVKKAIYTVKAEVVGVPIHEEYDTEDQAEARVRVIRDAAPTANPMVVVAEVSVPDES